MVKNSINIWYITYLIFKEENYLTKLMHVLRAQLYSRGEVIHSQSDITTFHSLSSQSLTGAHTLFQSAVQPLVAPSWLLQPGNQRHNREFTNIPPCKQLQVQIWSPVPKLPEFFS